MHAYLELLDKILTKGEEHDDRTGVGTLSLFGEQIRFDLREVFPLMTTKKLPLRWIAEELFWFLRGSTNEHELEAVRVDIWKEWATEEKTAQFGRKAGDLGPVYGYLWRNFGKPYKPDMGNYHINGVDQIARLMKDLTEKPNSRRHIVTGWDPNSCDSVALPPCHTLWQIKVQQVKEQLSRTPKPLPELIVHTWDEGDSFWTPLSRLLSFGYKDLELKNYNPYPSIKAEVAV